MGTGWQDAWTFRIVDQDTGAAVPGVPVTVLPQGGSEGGYWVSDADGLVRIPKHDGARLTLRVGLRNEEAIEFDARSLGDDPIPLAAPRAGPVGGAEPAPRRERSAPARGAPPSPQPGHVVRFARLAVRPQDQDIITTPDPAPPGASPAPADSGAIRYAALLELDQVWQSLGARAGDLLYSVSLGPGDEVKVVVSDGRWRKQHDGRERSFQIVAQMVAARQVAGGADVVPLDPCVAGDLEAAAAETVALLAERTVTAGEALRRRPLGVTELVGEQPAGTSVRTLRNMRPEGVLSYHVVEPVQRYQVIVRTPRLRPAMLVPFRLPNIATREVVRRFGHALRRALLDRALAPDVDQVLAPNAPAAAERRLYAHIAAHLPYYSAAIIAAGSPAERFSALVKLRDPEGRPLTEVIENVVVGRVGTYVAFPLRSLEYAPREWRGLLADEAVRRVRAFEEITVTLPLPGVWLRSELFPAQLANEREADSEGAEAPPAERGERRKKG